MVPQSEGVGLAGWAGGLGTARWRCFTHMSPSIAHTIMHRSSHGTFCDTTLFMLLCSVFLLMRGV